jgi:RNA polymerase sigma factor (sigma-70 family)
LADVPNRLREAIEAHYARVRSRMAFLEDDAATAADLTQEVFARFWEICLAQGEPRNVRAFLAGIERNVLLEHIGRRGRRPRMVRLEAEPTPDPSDLPCERAQRADTSRVLRELLSRLDPQQQWLIAGRHFLEMTLQELSDSSGLPRHTVVYHYNRGMERLRLLAIQNGISL